MGRPPRIHRDQILDAARSVFVARGFEGATLADVASRVGVTPAAILRHFASKQELFMSAMTAEAGLVPFLDELANTDAASDPRIVLRRFAEQAIPFIRRIVGAAVAVQMHIASRQTTLVVPFDASADSSPPRRALRIITDYFSRARDAGVIRGSNPRAMTLLFMGQLQAYVFIHEILNVTPVYPLDDYLDALIDLWVGGAIEGRAAGGTRARKQTKARKARPGDRDPDRRHGDAAVDARPAPAKAARPRGNAGGADGQRRVAGRRPRNPRPRR